MWFIEISLGSINYGSEPPYSVFFLFLPLFTHFLALKLSNQIPLGSLLSKGQLEMASKMVLPKHERKVRSPQPPCKGKGLPACFSLRLDYTEGKERTRKSRIYIARDLCTFKKQFPYCFLGAARWTGRFVNTWPEGPDRLCQHWLFLPVSLASVPLVHLREQTRQDRHCSYPCFTHETDAPWFSSLSLR